MLKPSKYQEAILEHVCVTTGPNMLIEAVAGSGKTATIKMAIDRLSPKLRVLYLVFNKRNQLEAQEKLPSWVDVLTFNALGHKILKAKRVKINKVRDLYIYDYLGHEPKPKDWHDAYVISRIVSLMKSYGWSIDGLDAPMPQTIIDKHGIDNVDDKIIDAVTCIFNSSLNYTGKVSIDFDDQIYLPVLHELAFPVYDIIFVDECQDLNPIKIKFIERLMHHGARVVAVGDSRQAIYGFAGADVEAMNKMRQLLCNNGRSPFIELPLSVNYRCSRKVIEAAQQIVPYIEPCDTAPEGSVVTSSTQEQYNNGDFILCRTTAPLVSCCLNLIRNNHRAIVLGRDIGTSLTKILKQLNGVNRDSSIAAAYDALELYYNVKSAALSARKNDFALTQLEDQVETLRVIFESCTTLEDAYRRIDSIFGELANSNNTQDQITLMTCHKSKGLEAKNIFVLKPEMLPHPKCKEGWQLVQEKNLKYVTITRAMENLTWQTT